MSKSISDQMHPAIGLGICGAVTGVVSWLISHFDIDPLMHILGVIFGAVVAYYLYRMVALSASKMVLVIVFFGASWQLAYRFAVEISGSIDNMLIVGALAGALGAAILALCFALLFMRFRAVVPILRTILVGAVAGSLLNVNSSLAMAALFIIWQAGVGASLGYDREVFDAA